MARVTAILKAWAKVIYRDLRRFDSLGGSNLLILVFFLRQSGGFVYALAALVLLVPAMLAPLNALPPERRRLWRLSPSEQVGVAAGGLLLNPAALLGLAVVVLAPEVALGPELLALAAVVVIAGGLLGGGVAFFSPRGWLRRLWTPTTTFWLLVRKDVRQFATTLDFGLAASLAAATLAYNLSAGGLPEGAAFGMTALIVVVLSTQAQTLFGRDVPGGVERYQLLSVSRVKVLLAKGSALLLLVALLTLPFAPLPALAAGLVTLTVGHYSAVQRLRPQRAWTFLGGSLFPDGVLQVILGIAVAAYVERESLMLLPAAFAAYLLSVLWFARILPGR